MRNTERDNNYSEGKKPNDEPSERADREDAYQNRDHNPHRFVIVPSVKWH